MLKPVITATALVALAGASFAYAEHGFGGDHGFGDGGPRAEQRHRMSVGDISAFADARIAALKAGLQLTPDQSKSWPPFEQAVRDLVQLRVQRAQARQAGEQQQQQAATPFERLSQRADNMAKTGAALKKIADAGTPLYQSLNDDQKNRFDDARAHAATPSWHAWRPRTRLARRPPRAEPFFLIALLLRARCFLPPCSGRKRKPQHPRCGFRIFWGSVSGRAIGTTRLCAHKSTSMSGYGFRCDGNKVAQLTMAIIGRD